ncbi:hypothetical protein ANO11243_013170 [Dothideomycetidae sp. 11243]|nr:hypothetical protein ANO11243_013170 [fungal sp. No.11243]
MAFAFNFANHDGEDAEDDLPDAPPLQTPYDHGESPSVPAIRHVVSDWEFYCLITILTHVQLNLLPSQLSYATVDIVSPTGKQLRLPRRELFDIRQQLMAEDSEATIRDLETSDLRTNVYEGGFKTWECSIDLASLLLDRGPRKDIDELARVANVIELGAGTALPTLILFQHALRSSYPMTFTLADFNADVLRLVTLPNLLLTYAWCFEISDTEKESPHGDLEVTPELVEKFLQALSTRHIEIQLLSGPWGPELAGFMPQSVPSMTSLVLAAETIYSPQSLSSFVDLLAAILKSGPSNKAMVAAKKFYFGVGGSTDALKVACSEFGMIAAEVENSGLTGMDKGVGRAIIEIQTI